MQLRYRRILFDGDQNPLTVLHMEKLALDHAIEQGLRRPEVVVTVALLCSDEGWLPFDPSIAVSNMAINIGNQF